jgi:hypothetical protein
MRLKDRIKRDEFESALGPAIRALGARQVILRLNAAARTAIPRQSGYAQLLPKLQLLCYDQDRPAVENELERIFDEHFEKRLGAVRGRFFELSDQLNQLLEGENLPADEGKRKKIEEIVLQMQKLLLENGFSPAEAHTVFSIKAFPQVLALYREKVLSPSPAG